MKRLNAALVLILVFCTCLCAATAETLGFGFVNATDVALRRGIGGKVLIRLPKDTCVWINDSRTDDGGELWYEIRAGLNIDHANYDYSGWMKASFIDTGETLWHDITILAANNCGMIVLRSDGTTETAGKPIVAMDGSRWITPKGWSAQYSDVVYVGMPSMGGNEYFVVTAQDEFISSVNGQRILNGREHAALLEAPLLYGEEPSWKDDETIRVTRTEALWNADTKQGEFLHVGLKADGTLVAEPAYLADLLAGWNDLTDVLMKGNFVWGLRRDGTVLSASLNNDPAFDTSHWQDVIAIGAGADWCVGLKADGTLVFAGDHVFMNEGHVRE